MIPEFDEHGNLPPGIHNATWPADADSTTYLDFFQCDRLRRQKGIIAIHLTGLP